jgi:hypothetical protein
MMGPCLSLVCDEKKRGGHSVWQQGDSAARLQWLCGTISLKDWWGKEARGPLPHKLTCFVVQQMAQEA